jgi:hypothetical protein
MGFCEILHFLENKTQMLYIYILPALTRAGFTPRGLRVHQNIEANIRKEIRLWQYLFPLFSCNS